jgi:GT2 family glycosyltransferase
MTKISILLPAYKSEQLLQDVFLRSYRKNGLNCELVIYDNGGNGELACSQCAGIDGLDNVKIVGDGKNIGLNAALNECAKWATGDYFYLPHTDMYLMPGWDTALLAACKNLPPTSYMLCSRSIEPVRGHTNFHIIKDYGKEAEEFNEEALVRDFANHKDNSVVSGYRMPFMVHRKLWERMSGVDENYFSYCTDDDLVQTAYDVGVRRFWMVNGSLVYHLQGKSNNQQKVDKDSNKPYDYFVEKWLAKGYGDAEHPAHWHPKLIPWYVKVK